MCLFPGLYLKLYGRKGQYVCDGCPNRESLKVCSHAVAAAEHNGDLDDFIQWLKKGKTAPNITKLVTASMPKGRGQKDVHPREEG